MTSPSSAPTAPASSAAAAADVALPGRRPGARRRPRRGDRRGRDRDPLGQDLTEIGRVPAPDADAVAISKRWLVWRARKRRARLPPRPQRRRPARPGPSTRSARPAAAPSSAARASTTTGSSTPARPRARTRSSSRLLGAKRKKRAKATLLRSRTEGLSNPSIRGGSLLYVRSTARADRLKLARVGGGGSGRTLLSRRTGTLWSTALSDRRAYVTLIHGSRPRQKILPSEVGQRTRSTTPDP